MDRVVIFGVFEFLGFRFCREFLNRGIEVIGITSDFEGNEDLTNKKRMEIGRNANFYEESISNWLLKGEITDQTFVLIDFYQAILMKKKEFLSELRSIEMFIRKCKQQIGGEKDSRILSLFPVQYYLEMNKGDQIAVLNDMGGLRVFLPTIYGPWQPDVFLFQQALQKAINPNKDIQLQNCEWIHDTLYIDDIVDPILKLIAGTTTDKPLLLKSNIPHHWEKCANYLTIPIDIYKRNNEKETIEECRLSIKTVNAETHYSQGIDNQKFHVKQLHEGRFL